MNSRLTENRPGVVNILGFGLFLLAAAGGVVPAAEIQRGVEGQTLSSSALPEITVRVSSEFEYAGKIEFRIRDVAAGERYIFVESDGGKVRKLFIFQFEGFLPGRTESYNYDFTRAMTFRGHRFRHNTFAFSNAEAARENPEGEAALTARFLKDKGYRIDDEWMMSRFLTVPDEERRHELILFYMERISATGHQLEDFYAGDRETVVWKGISGKLKRRSLASFDILAEPRE